MSSRHYYKHNEDTISHTSRRHSPAQEAKQNFGSQTETQTKVAPLQLITYNTHMNEEQVLETIKKLSDYLQDADAPITEAIENALYNLQDQLK